MFKYILADGELVKTEFESEKTVKDMIERTVVSRYVRCGKNSYWYRPNRATAKRIENSIFASGFGTKAFVPTASSKWDSTRKCFVWKHDGRPYPVYDASNVRCTIRGYYLSNFDTSTLPDAKNKKTNKKRYAMLNRYCEDSLADCKMWDNKAMENLDFDYSKAERLNEFRAWWAARQLLSKVFKENKRISTVTLTEMFIRTNYSSQFNVVSFTFGDYMRDIGEELIEYLTAETEKDGKSEGGRSDSDDGRP